VRGDIRCRWAAADALRCAGKIDEAKARLLLLEPEAERRQLNVLLRKIRRSLRLIGVPRAAARTSDGLLTGREREVLAFVAGGLTNDEIARRLGLGRPTVVRLIRSAQQKLGATSRTQAAALAARR
jgi:DNA-binding CsgD family transcriptional regulator